MIANIEKTRISSVSINALWRCVHTVGSSRAMTAVFVSFIRVGSEAGTKLAMTAYGRHFFTSGQRDNSSDWNASLPGIVASSL